MEKIMQRETTISSGESEGWVEQSPAVTPLKTSSLPNISWKDFSRDRQAINKLKNESKWNYDTLSHTHKSHGKSDESDDELYRLWCLANKDKTVTEQFKERMGEIQSPEGLKMLHESFSPKKTITVIVSKKKGKDSMPMLKEKSAPVEKMSPWGKTEDFDQKLEGYPGELKMTKAQSKKYFGVEARMDFFDRFQWIQRQRDVTSTFSGVRLNDLPLDSEKTNESMQTDDFAFNPVRTKKQINFASKITIRETSLLLDSPYESQTKLVAKRALLSNPSYEEDEDEDQDEQKNSELTAHSDNKGDISSRSELSGSSASTMERERKTHLQDEDGGNSNSSAFFPAVGVEPDSVSVSISNNMNTNQITTISFDPSTQGGGGGPTTSQITVSQGGLSGGLSRMVFDSRKATRPSSTGGGGGRKPKKAPRRPFGQTKKVLMPLSPSPTKKGGKGSSVGGGEEGKEEPEADSEKIPIVKEKSIMDKMRDRKNEQEVNEDKAEAIDIKTKWDFENKQEEKVPLLLVTVDRRDRHNPVVDESLASNNLLKYIMMKNKAFLVLDDDDQQDSDNDSLDDEIELMKNSSPFDLDPSLFRDPGKPQQKNYKKTQANETPRHSARPSSTSGERSILPEGMSLNMDGVKESGRNIKEEDESPTTNSISPRSKYIDACIRSKLNPRASLVLRKTFTKCLNLRHQGIGDEMANLFADAIVNIPFIESLDVEDNNLTDKGLGPIVKSIVNMKSLVDLNLSNNVIGPVAAACLAEYLSRANCPLKRFTLSTADVDDGECENFVSALMTNVNLTDLDLSHNLIGSSEQLNTVYPDLVTGGEAIAELLRSPTCALTSLKLVWNMIRLDSGIDLAQSISVNQTLTYLDLSYNALGTDGGITLGYSLQDNTVLKTLLIANNAIDARACLTICAGIIVNKTLSRVSFNGNPIGVEGAKTLMLLPTMIGSRVELTASGCNLGLRDPKCWFDSGTLVRKFEIKLEDPFERAVAILLLNIIPAHQTYLIANSEWFDPEVRGDSTKLGLVERVFQNENSSRIDKSQIPTINNLKKLQSAAADLEKAETLFNEIDQDGSGELDEEEFGDLLDNLGMDIPRSKVGEIIAEYDLDGGGVIELAEFLLFLKAQKIFADTRLKELTEFPLVVRKIEMEAGAYDPPRTGKLILNVVDGFKHKPTYRVISASDQKYIDALAASTGDLITMTAYGVQNLKIRLAEGLSMVEAMQKESTNKPYILGKVLPRLAKQSDARILVNKVFNSDKMDIARCKFELGAMCRPMLGNADGFYSLDMSNNFDRICIGRLLEVSSTNGYIRGKASKLGYQAIGDCSQHQNWTCFRNEMFNGNPIVITTAFVSPYPKSGKLEFDFVSQRRKEETDVILNDLRVVNLLDRLYLLRHDERDLAMLRLRKAKKDLTNTLPGDGTMVYETSHPKAQEISLKRTAFYKSLAERGEKNRVEEIKESVKVFPSIYKDLVKLHEDMYGDTPFKLTHTLAKEVTPSQSLYALDDVNKGYKNKVKIVKRSDLLKGPGTASRPGTADPNDEQFSGFENDPNSLSRPGTSETITSLPASPFQSRPQTADTGGGFSARPQTAGSDSERDEPNRKLLGTLLLNNEEVPENLLVQHKKTKAKYNNKEKALDAWMQSYVQIISSDNINENAKAAKSVEVIVEIFENTWMRARHLALISDLFQGLGRKHTSELHGTYRVELICKLFFSVVDIHNFEVVMKTLNAYECACVICRVGWLHIYNPMKPEGGWEFDLRVLEERRIMKTLAMLSIQEPGDNFIDVYFRWDREMETMPGYELTQPWMTEEGLPKKGIWGVIYYSGEGKGKKGCKVRKDLRKSMLNMFFIDEEDVYDDEVKEDPDNPREPLEGEKAMMKHLGIYHAYLNHNHERALEFQREKAEKEGPGDTKGKKKK